MSDHTVNIRLLDKNYQLKCSPESEEALKNASEYLDNKLRDVRDKGRVTGSDRIATMTALNLAYELIQRPAITPPASNNTSGLSPELQQRLQAINHEVVAALDARGIK